YGHSLVHDHRCLYTIGPGFVIGSKDDARPAFRVSCHGGRTTLQFRINRHLAGYEKRVHIHKEYDLSFGSAHAGYHLPWHVSDIAVFYIEKRLDGSELIFRR